MKPANVTTDLPIIAPVNEESISQLSKAPKPSTSQPARILVVDDNEAVRSSLEMVLTAAHFQVKTAASVGEALSLINTEPFDVLLSDLHMPNAGDGFTVVSAMRHTNPLAITLVFTGYPALKEAMNAILLQADEILIKPMAIPELLKLVREKLDNRQPHAQTNPQRVATILEGQAPQVIAEWLKRVEREEELTSIPLSVEARTGHLPKLIEELVRRLRDAPQKLGSKHTSDAAALHGLMRKKQGYSITMIIEESRILQVSIFDTLQKNLSQVDFSLLLHDVMTIADEVDAQLKETVSSFIGQTSAVAA
ncbi:MAG TPA: response regulator [Terriglobales bacterium]|nr:response regulator [Terriglobales bacterium]